jgi:hypothetical protein
MLEADGTDVSESSLYLLQTDISLQYKVIGHPRIEAYGDVFDAEDEGTGFWQTDVQVVEPARAEDKVSAQEGQVPAGIKPIAAQPVSSSLSDGKNTKRYAGVVGMHTAAEAAAAAAAITNGTGDVAVFLAALTTYSIIILMCILFFIAVRDKFPLTYQHNLGLNLAPLDSIPPEPLGWVRAAWNATATDVMANRGLDQAMVFEFTNLGMRIMGVIALAMFCVVGPMNLILGGHAAGSNYLINFSLGNVAVASPLYWGHALIVWCIVVIVQTSMHETQKVFLSLRQQWLRELPSPRATTILVEGIPPDYRSDEALASFFKKMFNNIGANQAEDKVISAYVVRKAADLEETWNTMETKRLALKKAHFRAQKVNATPQDREIAVALQDELTELQKEVAVEQLKVKDRSSMAGEDGFYTSAGFVSFTRKSDAILALGMQCGEEADTWRISQPPEPDGVLFRDLQQDCTHSLALRVFGYTLLAILFMLYVPAAIGIMQIAKSVKVGMFQPLWQAIAPAAGLQIMVCFLPTLLMPIFRVCFTLKNEYAVQQHLQTLYFLFNIFVVILVTAIGDSMSEFLTVLFSHPLRVFSLLGNTASAAEHFYMNYLVLQWVVDAMVLTRSTQLGKWIIFRNMYDDETARQMSEPEDQDFHGIGSRSCRLTINLCIGVIYGAMSPPCAVLCFIEFLVARIVYGYLLPFAETRKLDSGGHFWVASLRHLLLGNVIYIIIITVVFMGKAASSGPAIISSSSLFYLCWSIRRFEMTYPWQNLPLNDVMVASEECQTKLARPNAGQYLQPFMKNDYILKQLETSHFEAATHSDVERISFTGCHDFCMSAALAEM